MFHAPVPIDAERQDSDLRAEAAEPIGFDAGNERLREAHLHNGQVEARALFAPFFAVTAVAAALIAAWAMYGSVELKLVVGWVALVAFANWVSCRRAMDAAARGQQPHRPAARPAGSRSPRRSASPASGRRCRPTPSPPSRRTSRS